MPRLEAVVVHADHPDTDVRLEALHRNGFPAGETRWQLVASAREQLPQPDVVRVEAHDPRVVDVMAAAMSDSSDGYDTVQVERFGPAEAARRYRDSMAESLDDRVVWLGHEGPSGLDGVALTDCWPDDEWMLTYLGVDPAVSGRRVGRRLAVAVRGAAADAGATSVAAEVDDGTQLRGPASPLRDSRSARTGPASCTTSDAPVRPAQWRSEAMVADTGDRGMFDLRDGRCQRCVRAGSVPCRSEVAFSPLGCGNRESPTA